MDEQKLNDLALLHALALMNCPTDPELRKVSMDAFRSHEEKCFERYGIEESVSAMFRGVLMPASE